MRRFEGQVVIVTGAGHGIWRAVAIRFAREGANLVVNDIDPARAAAVVRDIEADGGAALSAVGDVADTTFVDGMFNAALDRFGTIDVLVNNAGLITMQRHFLEADEAWWNRVLDVNLKAAFLCSLRAARIMVRRRSGSIINMSSGGATRAHRGNVAYDASKGGIEAMTRDGARSRSLRRARQRGGARPDPHVRHQRRRGRGTRAGGPARPAGIARRRCRPDGVPCGRRRAVHDGGDARR
jgi:3-oxoacyl-[acyl-carrier protein] reductase